jgi:hypothetical protein
MGRSPMSIFALAATAARAAVAVAAGLILAACSPAGLGDVESGIYD